VQLTELLYQRVKELGLQGQFALRPGYVAVVSKARVLRAAILAPLFPGPDDHLHLVLDPKAPTRIGVGFTASDKSTWRLMREFGAARQLHKYDPATRKFALLTDDDQEIESFLRIQCGLPLAETYAFFVLGAAELPSQRSRAAAPAAAGGEQVRRLEEEIRVTRDYEVAQDQLFKVQNRLEEIGGSARSLADAESALKSAEAQLSRSPWPDDQIADLTSRAKRAEQDAARRDIALDDVARKRERAASDQAGSPEPFWASPWFYGGLLLGIAVDVIAFALRRPLLAAIALVPYAAALVAVLRFIQVDEGEKEARQNLVELKEQEEAVKRRFNDEQAPLRAALRAAKVKTAGELLNLFEERKEAALRRDAARAQVERVRKDSGAAVAAAEVARLQEEKAQLEKRIFAQGFARPMAEIEGDLQKLRGTAPSSGASAPEGVQPKALIAAAAALLGQPPQRLVTEMTPRLAQFLAALTERRIVGGAVDAKGELVLSGANGKTSALDSLPQPLRDLAYGALRLCLLEKVAMTKKLPVIVDDSFAPLDPQKRAVAAKMLKAIAAHTQVIHRIADALPEGIADQVVQT
jgi:hypothetical protein